MYEGAYYSHTWLCTYLSNITYTYMYVSVYAHMYLHTHMYVTRFARKDHNYVHIHAQFQDTLFTTIQ